MNDFYPLLKDMKQDQVIYALIKGDDIKYVEGKVLNVGLLRMDINKNISMPVNVIDITYELNGKTFTDVIGVNDSTFSTKKPGAVTLVATSKDVILKEVKTSLKLDEEFLNSVDKTIERKKNNVELYKSLILELDTEWAKLLAIENRISNLENNSKETNILLKTILDKLG